MRSSTASSAITSENIHSAMTSAQLSRRRVRFGRKKRPPAIQELLGKVNGLFAVFPWCPVICSGV